MKVNPDFYSRPLLVNLGCGQLATRRWQNFDLSPQLPFVHAWRMSDGIPLDAGVVDAVYHSHFLEHLAYPDALSLLRECARVVKAGGILRVVVPDFEYNCRLYLDALSDVSADSSPRHRERYEWATLNLFDQMVRAKPGGQLAQFFSRAEHADWNYVVETTGGTEADEMRSGVLNYSPPNITERIRRAVANPKKALRTISGKASVALQRVYLGNLATVIRPIVSGELHRWGWDRHSLRMALEEAGFAEARVVGPTESSIPAFVKDNLDTDENGRPRKPHSLYMEARRRGA